MLGLFMGILYTYESENAEGVGQFAVGGNGYRLESGGWDNRYFRPLLEVRVSAEQADFLECPALSLKMDGSEELAKQH